MHWNEEEKLGQKPPDSTQVSILAPSF